ncbi:hypothetical protein PC9H_001437 [Pleurotus ostreatus]|uniref:Uncharacterized protein n=1 Tax=Pleurotus ostreatus TaxID=5322 RepID=A0A8H7A341_PLEOS|nr:uncharacterized protein PC9H_001437 [Pleurotus ostreatus]KAF7441088.1 hypothetical protein PC9H_001437 [Pleurotus ostreatus]KAJ8699430.1 hypothetical protein PTI98_002545 [Pleurotus ostreatus]
MVGTRKRAADESAGPATRSSKVAKTKKAASPGKAAKGGKGAKAAPSTSNFKAKALPIHIHMTHTPASIDEDTVSTASKDPGSLGSVTLLPSTFSTGSYGWKGSKRITVELQNTENGEEKETVQVMVTINAAVLGSKNAKHDGEEEAAAEDGKVEEQAAEDANAAKDAEAAEQTELTDQAEAEDKTESA